GGLDVRNDMGDEVVRFRFELSSPELSEDEVFDLAERSQEELAADLRSELSDVHSGELTVEIAQGSVLLYLIYEGGTWLIVEGGAGVIGAGAVELIKRAPRVISLVLGKKKEQESHEPGPEMQDRPPVIVVRPDMSQEEYGALVETLLGHSDEEIENIIKFF